MWIWKIQRYLDIISWLKRRTNFQIQIMKKFLLDFIIRFFFPFHLRSTDKGFGLRATEA